MMTTINNNNNNHDLTTTKTGDFGVSIISGFFFFLLLILILAQVVVISYKLWSSINCVLLIVLLDLRDNIFILSLFVCASDFSPFFSTQSFQKFLSFCVHRDTGRFLCNFSRSHRCPHISSFAHLDSSSLLCSWCVWSRHIADAAFTQNDSLFDPHTHTHTRGRTCGYKQVH